MAVTKVTIYLRTDEGELDDREKEQITQYLEDMGLDVRGIDQHTEEDE